MLNHMVKYTPGRTSARWIGGVVAMRLEAKDITTAARSVELERALAALRLVLPRIVDLVRSATRPEAVAVGEWRVVDVAAHLSHVAAGELMVANTIGQDAGLGLPVEDDLVEAASRFNSASLGGDGERDPSVLAERIHKSVNEFLESMATTRGDEEVGWLGGLVLPSSCLVTHLLEELLIHGFDMSRAQKDRWEMDPGHAALGFGFFLDVLRLCPPTMRSFFVNPEKGAELQACLDLRMRGGRRDFIIFEGGSVWVEAPSERTIDCHIFIDPRIAMLAGFGRISSTRAALSGRIVAWGRRPLLALKFPHLIRNP